MGNALEEIRTLLESIQAQVTALEDLEEIKRLIVSYARGCDQGNDPDLIGPLFAENGTWECKGFGKYTGRQTLASGLHGIAGEKIWWSLHYMVSPLIKVSPSGDSATAFWYLWESATVPDSIDDKATPHWIGGTYDTTLTKINDRWYFQSMELNLNMVSPYESGWVKSRFLQGSHKAPYLMNMKAGLHLWCTCGRSEKQPFCDGSHKGTDYKPLRFNLEEDQHVALCGCKRTETGPHCDGTHLDLPMQKGN